MTDFPCIIQQLYLCNAIGLTLPKDLDLTQLLQYVLSEKEYMCDYIEVSGVT